MKQEWQHDVAVLKARVANAEKNDPGLTGVREYCANTGNRGCAVLIMMMSKAQSCFQAARS